MNEYRSAEGADYKLMVLAILGLILILGRYGFVNLGHSSGKEDAGIQEVIFWMSGLNIEDGFYAIPRDNPPESGTLTKNEAMACFPESFVPEDGHAYRCGPNNEPRPEDLPDAAALLFLQPININTAQRDQLMTIKGVGEQLAERIIHYRHQVGSIDSKKALENIHGIGPQKAAMISRFVRFQ